MKVSISFLERAKSYLPPDMQVDLSQIIEIKRKRTAEIDKKRYLAKKYATRNDGGI